MAKQKTEKQAKGNGSKALQRQKAGGQLGAQLASTPFAFMKRFGEEMDHLFEDFGIGSNLLVPVFRGQFGEGWAPQVEMFERGNQLVVRADLPGLTKDDVKVELSNDAITIEGERKDEHQEKGEDFYRSERSYGTFYRKLPMPEGVKAENANATFNNGVLEITMPAPKHTEQKARRLEISQGRQEQARRKAA